MTSAEILGANWRPVAPFRDLWEDEEMRQVMDIVLVGVYPIKRLKVATRRAAP